MNPKHHLARFPMRAWILAPSLLLVLLSGFLLMRSPRETLSFEIVDYVTGKPIQNATVQVLRAWTRLPLDKIPGLGIKPWHETTVRPQSNAVKITGVARSDPTCWIVIGATGYAEASVKQVATPESRNLDSYCIFYSPAGSNLLHDSLHEYVNRKKSFTVALEPVRGGTGRAGARFPTAPSPGSRERAITAASHRAESWGWKQVTADSASFRNGHWEIKVSSAPPRIGGDAEFDVAEDGEVLWVQPGY